MKFVLEKHYNIPETLFSHEPKLTYSYVGNLLVDQVIGPTGCTAIDDNRTVSLKKAVSETLERRALMAGGYSKSKETIGYYNLIDQTVGSTAFDFSRYRVNGKYISDTTGTAVAYNSHDAIYKATTELLEKNSLFLFWYGLLGKEVHITFENPYLAAMKSNGYHVNVYEVDYFHPFITYITIIHNGHHCVYAYGVAGDLDNTKALNQSIKESYLILWQNTFKVKRDISLFDEFNRSSHIDFIQHLKKYTKTVEFTPNKSEVKKQQITEIIDILPEWITELNVVMLHTNSRQRQKVVLVFSRDLLNSVPLKRVIDLDLPINKETINLSEQQFEKIPNCMIV